MARKKLRGQPYELLRKLLNTHKTLAEEDIAEAGYPTDREELRARLVERARQLCSTFEEELERLDPTLMKMHENGGAKIDHRAAILSRVRAAQN